VDDPVKCVVVRSKARNPRNRRIMNATVSSFLQPNRSRILIVLCALFLNVLFSKKLKSYRKNELTKSDWEETTLDIDGVLIVGVPIRSQ
jgi:hypothetical protein